MIFLPADRHDLTLDRAFAGEISIRAAIARKTDSEPPHAPCPYCPDFDPRDPGLAGQSSYICATCDAQLNAQIDRLEAGR